MVLKVFEPLKFYCMCISLSQNLLNTFNNMLLVGIGDTRTCTQLVDFCTACLAAGKVLRF